jgi:uncharacterized protein (TIGR02246 family)
MSAAAIAANNRALEAAMARGDSAAMGAMFAPDIAAFPPDGPIVNGRDAVTQLWASAMKDHGVKGCKLDTISVEISGDLAIEVAEGTLKIEAAGGKIEDAKIKYICVWKQIGGKWLLYRDIWNSMPA